MLGTGWKFTATTTKNKRVVEYFTQVELQFQRVMFYSTTFTATYILNERMVYKVAPPQPTAMKCSLQISTLVQEK